MGLKGGGGGVGKKSSAEWSKLMVGEADDAV